MELILKFTVTVRHRCAREVTEDGTLSLQERRDAIAVTRFPPMNERDTDTLP
jgi:hypothetical protein